MAEASGDETGKGGASSIVSQLGMRRSCDACGRKKRRCDGGHPCRLRIRAGIGGLMVNTVVEDVLNSELMSVFKTPAVDAVGNGIGSTKTASYPNGHAGNKVFPTGSRGNGWPARGFASKKLNPLGRGE